MITLRSFIAAILVSLLIGCSSSPNKFSDTTLLAIADYQDHRQTDSLIQFLLNKNPEYRTAAALALASVQDSAAALQLGNMVLEDPLVEARMAAAFALGQTNCIASSNALIPALQDKDIRVKREVLEALGKTIRKEDLSVLKAVLPIDTLSQIGLAWANYQLGLRGLADSTIVAKQSEFLKNTYPEGARLGAVHFFNRVQNIKINRYSTLLLGTCADKNVFVRITAVNALRKLDSAAAVNTLIRILKTDTDYRVRISAVRALASFNSLKASQAVIESLHDSNANVGIAASETLKALPELETQILEKSKATKNWRIQSNLYKLALELGKAGIEEEIIRLYKKSTNDYQKAALLNAASVSMAMFDFIANELKNNSVLVVKTTGAQALVNLNQKFSKERQQDFAVTYQEAILQGDPGVIGIVTSALKNPELKFKELIKDYSFLLVAKSKLSLPKDVEALQPLEEAIAYFEGKEKPNFPTNPFNHPIDWKLVKSIPANQQVKIKTDKGDVILKLWVEEAPGSVANFVELVNKKYFNNKNFHRVVPNFVIQGGCNRGDGFGSEDYSIRSEFNLRRYTEGSVGMASAGKDTEGTQWFITHSPTPHLDGRYTIFATVSKGMEVVHAMEVGDKIIDVSLIK